MPRYDGSTNIVRNVSAVGDAYRYHDQHVDDTQDGQAFRQLQNGWTAVFIAALDQWKVQTPSGLNRTYVRV